MTAIVVIMELGDHYISVDDDGFVGNDRTDLEAGTGEGGLR